MTLQALYLTALDVSALAAEWIEISPSNASKCPIMVSALAAEWIEIYLGNRDTLGKAGLRPRGGVD